MTICHLRLAGRFTALLPRIGSCTSLCLPSTAGLLHKTKLDLPMRFMNSYSTYRSTAPGRTLQTPEFKRLLRQGDAHNRSVPYLEIRVVSRNHHHVEQCGPEPSPWSGMMDGLDLPE